MGEPSKVSAKGRKFYDDHLDEVTARLDFTNGRMAELRANRNSLTDERLMSFNFDSEPPININFHQKSNDALMEEVMEFIRSIEDRTRPTVSGTEGLIALKIANTIREAVERNV